MSWYLKKNGIVLLPVGVDVPGPAGTFSTNYRDEVDHNAIPTGMETRDSLGRIRDSRTPWWRLQIWDGTDPFVGWSTDDTSLHDHVPGTPPAPILS